jgi:hypothetical protein
MGALSRGPGGQCPPRSSTVTVWRGPLVSSGACPATGRVTKPATFSRSEPAGTG